MTRAGSAMIGPVVAVCRRYPTLVRAVMAVLSGLLLFGSFPPRPLWFLAPLGLALLVAVVHGNGRLRGGFGFGFLAGLGFFVPLLPWTGIYVGPVPWLALSTVCALYFGAFGAVARLVGALPGWPLWTAAAWVAAEWVRSSFPFGGFPWGRVAFGQADGWYLPLASVGGAPLIGFAVALTATAAVALLGGLRAVFATEATPTATTPTATADAVPGPAPAANEQPVDGDVTDDSSAPPATATVTSEATDVRARSEEGATLSSWRRSDAAAPPPARAARIGILLAAATLVLTPLVGLALRATLPAPDDGVSTVTVAAIQGSVPRLGLDFNAQRRAVLDNHVRRTNELADAVAAGQAAKPDVVIWPENASDIDPVRNRDAAALISDASERIGAPILVGAVLVNSDRTTTNSVLVWNGAAGPGDRHDKKIIQPFGEYLPMRELFRHFSEYADRAGYFVPGHGDGTVHAGGVDIGVATCYEVAFDRAFEDSMRAGAQLLTVPTNNATFGDSEMTYQQLAMSRVRAVEHGRALVVAATTGVSAIVTADGALAQQSAQFVPAALVASLPLRTQETLATRVGPAPEYALVAVTVVAGALAALRRRRN
ncbi:apolipoprotein N-acyltransferase [Nocardia callitridis]|uniref:Apolipoprotein N-acyltransferase n=1 Tax=Nocardia callitridis TaxID=648753 RepID=A0ABP9K6Y9_9NOCA